MKFAHWIVAALMAAATCTASAQVTRIFEGAEFVSLDDGIELLGFGRGGTVQSVPASFAAGAGDSGHASPTATRELFIDTWNIDTSGVAPGTYSFPEVWIEASGSVVFSAIVFNSYDEAGLRHQILFAIDAAGMQASGQGTFTILASCPVVSCVWFDVIGTQDVGSPPIDGYAPSTRMIAAVVPEPSTVALWAAGLALVGGAAARRRRR